MRVLLRWVSARRFGSERARVLVTVLGVALGVAVFVAIRLANVSALASFSDTVDAVAGRANLRLSAGAEGVDERWFVAARETPGVLAAAPVIELPVAARAGGALRAGEGGSMKRRGYAETLLVLGVDLFSERSFARHGSAAADRGADSSGVAGALEFLAEPRAVAITRTLARRHGLAPGDTLTVLAAGRPEPLVVRRVIEDAGLQQAFGGNVVVIDIAEAQVLFQRLGRLDRIDLLVPPGSQAAVTDRLAARLPPGIEIGLPQGRTRQVETMVGAFRLNLAALSFVALLTASFLIFNAVSMSVVRRRGELGTLRALGVTRRTVTGLVLVEGAVLGAIGSLLGLGLGTLLARAALGAVARTLSDLYLIEHASVLHADPGTYAIGSALGVVTALLASLAPALEASRVPPQLTLRQGSLIEARPVPVARLALSGAAVLVGGAFVALAAIRFEWPVLGFVSALLIVAGFALATPAATLAIESVAAPVLGRLLGYEAALGARSLREAVARTSVMVAAVMVAVGMMVALAIMVGSFRRTVDTWVVQSLRGDLYVEAAGHRLDARSATLPRELVESVRRIPRVAAVDTYRGGAIAYRGARAFLAAIDFDVQRGYGRLRFTRGTAEPILAAAKRERGAIVTESFARHHHVAVGDTLELEAASGPARLRVHGVFYDYTTDAGAVLVDRALYSELWNEDRTESLALYLAPGAHSDSVRTAVLRIAGPERVLFVTPNGELRRRVLDVFDQTFEITWALQGIAVVVAVLGVIGTLLALIFDRSREIGTLRAAGALRSQIRRMVVVESALLGLIGALLGCVCGVALAIVLVHVIQRQYFGWTILLHVDPLVLIEVTALMVVTAALGGLLPARLAAGRLPAEALRME